MLACACGLDPSSESTMLHSLLLSGVLSVPFIAKDQILAWVRQRLGRATPVDTESCSGDDGTAPSA
jgi:hypothetical protein